MNFRTQKALFLFKQRYKHALLVGIIFGLCFSPFANAHIHLANAHKHEQANIEHHHSHQQTHSHAHHDQLEDHHTNLNLNIISEKASHVDINNIHHFATSAQLYNPTKAPLLIPILKIEYHSFTIIFHPQHSKIKQDYFTQSNVNLRAPPFC